jgi:hypothetical protein
MAFAQQKFSTLFRYVLDDVLAKNRGAAAIGKGESAPQVPDNIDLIAARRIKIYPASQWPRAASDI